MQPVFKTSDVAETVALGVRLGRLVTAGDFVALSGDLGAGKTCFARGVAAGLDVPSSTAITSPTYTLLNSYAGRLPLYHFDLYRLAAGEVQELGFDEFFFGNGVCLVEWAERLGSDLPVDYLQISFTCEEDENRRALQLVPHGERAEELVRQFLAPPGTLASRYGDAPET